ncbi:MAG: diaminopimelate decarboxylase [Planctomycetes bacterium]|nr:diaminopimelate decarboxylase [Planctomycetota bacterium]MBI3847466.1 diaminopimelate decarboxylase [Planctomycetota bacterium]
MDHFVRRDGRLFAEGVPLTRIAELHGTPTYVYSEATIRTHFDRVREAFSTIETHISYSVKACPNLAICRLLQSLGAGFDVVSGGELARALEASGRGEEIVFAGVGKTDDEIRFGLRAGVFFFNVESRDELIAVSRIATETGSTARVALRLNPDVDPGTHRYITTGKRENKFGIDLVAARALAREATSLGGISIEGVHVHLGSQITDPAPYGEALDRLREPIADLRQFGHRIQWLNVGGGFGIFYRGGDAIPAESFAKVIVPRVRDLGCRLILEPGRFIVGNAGVLVTRVVRMKPSSEAGRFFVVCDAAMNDLIRPSLYGAWHAVWPVECAAASDVDLRPDEGILADVVGPICESGDFLAKDRRLPAVASGDLLAVRSVGAYGFSMSSNYNSRPRAAEVLVSGDRVRLVRRRETLDDLLGPERGLE